MAVTRSKSPKSSVEFVPVSANASVDHAVRDDGRKTIAVRIWDWSEWCRQVLWGIQSFAHDRPDWRLYVDVGQTSRPQVYSDDVRFDGVVTHVLNDHRGWKRLLSRNKRLKLVAFSASVPHPLNDLPRVKVDDSKVAEIIGRHLINGGFRRLAYCGSGISSTALDLRQREVERFAFAHELPCETFRPSLHKAGGLDNVALRRWLEELAKPVGIVTWNIEIARRVIQACKRSEIDVPSDINVVAWDDDPMLAEMLEPTISAAVLAAERLGFEAAILLDKLLSDDQALVIPVVVQPSGLIRVRQSSDVWALKDREVYMALQSIREHAAGPLKIPQIARHVGISRKKLELDFARVLKQTPYDAVIDVRMEVANSFC